MENVLDIAPIVLVRFAAGISAETGSTIGKCCTKPLLHAIVKIVKSDFCR